MSAQNFGILTHNAPNPAQVAHPAGGAMQVGYTCHMAVMQWAFIDRGDPQAAAAERVAAIARAKCQGCAAGAHAHNSIRSDWYGANFCFGAKKIQNRASLYPWVNVGDVLIVGLPSAPIHSMVVVRKSTLLGRPFVYIRGFNNHGTLGTGPHNGYDNADRDIDRARYWRMQGAGEIFGQAPGGETLWRVPYASFTVSANAVRNGCIQYPDGWHYGGP